MPMTHTCVWCCLLLLYFFTSLWVLNALWYTCRTFCRTCLTAVNEAYSNHVFAPACNDMPLLVFSIVITLLMQLLAGCVQWRCKLWLLLWKPLWSERTCLHSRGWHRVLCFLASKLVRRNLWKGWYFLQRWLSRWVCAPTIIFLRSPASDKTCCHWNLSA